MLSRSREPSPNPPAQWNATAREFPEAERGLVGLFQDRVAAHPERVALTLGSERICFADLAKRASAFARHLGRAGVGPGHRVGILLERSFDSVAAALGVLEAGAAYVPLDPAYPAARLAFMVEDSGALLLVTSTTLVPRVPPAPVAVPVVFTDDVPAAGSVAPPGAPTPRDEDAAYVIYTSGSTGTPKGVVGLHGATLNRLCWGWRELPFEDGEVACLKTAPGFVDSVAEMFAPLLAGVPAVVVPDAEARDPRRLVEALGRHGVTRLVLVPSLLSALLDHIGDDLSARLPRLRLWICSGEALPAELARRFRRAAPGARLLNLYGSSEVAADVTWYDVAALPAGAERVPIGRPIANTRVYVVDAQDRPVPVGEPGELLVGGRGVAGGYLARPEQTAERFVADPFSGETGARLYRTGDRARFLDDGNLEFLGRLDRQVQLRGVRIEPGEIETALLRDPAVAGAAVLLRRVAGEEQLVAYVTARDPLRHPAASDIRGRLRAALPEPMVPGHVVWLERLPLTPSGKLDRDALPEPEPSAAPAPVAEPPQGLLERLLAEIWAEVLPEAEPPSRHADFFEMGGHSLLAVSLLSRVEAALGKEIPLAVMFDAPTVAGLAQAIRSIDTAPRCPMLPVRAGAAGARPLFFVPSGRGAFQREEVNILGLRRLAQALGADRPLYAFCLERDDVSDVGRWTLARLAERFVERLRSVQPSGPYRVGGYSFGGRLAFEAACRLCKAGEQVELLALVDTFGPGFPRMARALSWRRWRGALARRLPWAASRSVADEGPPPPASYRDLAGLLERGGFHPGHFPGRVTLFRSPRRGYDETGACWDDQENGWTPWCAGVDVVPIEAAHESILSEEGVSVLAPALARYLGAVGVS